MAEVLDTTHIDHAQQLLVENHTLEAPLVRETSATMDAVTITSPVLDSMGHQLTLARQASETVQRERKFNTNDTASILQVICSRTQTWKCPTCGTLAHKSTEDGAHRCHCLARTARTAASYLLAARIAATKLQKARGDITDVIAASRKRELESETPEHRSKRHKKYRDRVREAKSYLKFVEFADPNGKCCICHTRKPDEIDHMRPNDVMPDGMRRKSINFGSCLSMSEVQREIQRNTTDGVCWLQSLCHKCHTLKDRIKLDSITSTGSEAARRREYMNTTKRAMNGGRCAYPDCPEPHDLCAEGTEAFFHLDHLHPQACRCSLCSNNPELKKRDNVSTMAIGSVKAATWDQFVRELQPDKVRLLHGSCHWAHSRAQRAAGIWLQ